MSEANKIVEHYYTSGYIRKVLSYFFEYYSLPIGLLSDYENSICLELLNPVTSTTLIKLSSKNGECKSKDIERFIYKAIKNTIIADVTEESDLPF